VVSCWPAERSPDLVGVNAAASQHLTHPIPFLPVDGDSGVT
jgi:hypothetical protein